MKRLTLLLLVISSALLLASCGSSPINTDLDPSGTYLMTIEYTDFDVPCTMTLTRQEGDYFKAVWDYGAEDGSVFETAALCFGEKYLAICEPNESPVLDIFSIGEGSLNGFWVRYGSDAISRVYGVTKEGNELPDPPVLKELDKPGNYTLEGDNIDDTTYVGYEYLEAHGKVIACDQTITSGYDAPANYQGVGVIIDDYLVLAVASFLSLYSANGDDWDGVWLDYNNGEVANENLDYTN
jgi:hypothetical protein